ncbi:MAG TPA: GatB/YqeY domain-containing protein [Usitatibacteraceae bacterium]|nr:GatB/YqeY domain-containing protein [Usitatibacteraceae bacterium]
MLLRERVMEDVKAAMKAREAERLGTLRLLTAAMKQREVDERITLDDAGIVAVIEKMLKQRRDSVAQYELAGRQDLADVEKREMAILQAYLPQQLTEAEIAAIVADAVAATGAKAPSDMGRVMAIVKPGVAGRADMGRVSALVKAKLAG